MTPVDSHGAKRTRGHIPVIPAKAGIQIRFLREFKMRRTSFIFLVPAALLFVSGCNGNVTNPTAPLNPGALTCDVPDGQQDGTVFISSGATVTDQSDVYSVVATQDQGVGPANEIHLRIPKNSSVPYTVSAPPDNNADIIYYDFRNNLNYDGNAAQGSVTITITQISPTLEGSFSARTVCSGITDSVRTLTNGVFNASY